MLKKWRRNTTITFFFFCSFNNSERKHSRVIEKLNYQNWNLLGLGWKSILYFWKENLFAYVLFFFAFSVNAVVLNQEFLPKFYVLQVCGRQSSVKNACSLATVTSQLWVFRYGMSKKQRYSDNFFNKHSSLRVKYKTLYVRLTASFSGGLRFLKSKSYSKIVKQRIKKTAFYNSMTSLFWYFATIVKAASVLDNIICSMCDWWGETQKLGA